MLASKGNICPRCSKQRIVIKSWEEKVNDSVVFFTTTSCPDFSCQKKVDLENEKIQQRRAGFMFAKTQKIV